MRSVHVQSSVLQGKVARAVAKSPLSIRQCLENPPPVERFGAYWSAVILRGLSVLRELPQDDVLHLSCERLLDVPVETLRRVQCFLEEPIDLEEWFRLAAGLVRRGDSVRRVPSEAASERLCRACSVGMRELSRLRAEWAA
jgi:hypothetical protein